MPLIPQTQNLDGRIIATAPYRNQIIEVVAGYDINQDAYRFHVYVTNTIGVGTKVDCQTSLAHSEEQAISEGLKFGTVLVDAVP